MLLGNPTPDLSRIGFSGSWMTGAASHLTTTLLAAALTAGAFVPAATSDDDEDEVPFDVANVIAELNDTDGDLGFHALIDGDAWNKVEIEDPTGRRLLRLFIQNRLRRQGLTELFFESAEPPFDELPPEEFFARFPEGVYEISGRTIDGRDLESEAQFTHVMPAPANITSPPLANCETPAVVTDPQITIEWDPVVTSHPDLGRSDPAIQIVGYEAVVSRDEPTPLTQTVELPPDVTMLAIPAEFIETGAIYKFEVLTMEASGNRTAVESCFIVEN